MDFIFGRTIGLLTRTLDVRAAEQRAIVSNIANSETPGYRARDVDFKEAMEGALGDTSAQLRLTGTNPAHFGGDTTGAMNIIVKERPVSDIGFDANSVDIEDEMGRLSGNYMAYNLSAKILRKKFSILMTAIKEGR